MADLMMRAAADVEGLMMAFMRDQGAAEMETKIRGLWMQLPDEMKEKFKRDNPEAYRAFMDSMKHK